MPLYFIKDSILKIPADVIVNPSDGVDFNENVISQAIAKAAGKEYIKSIGQFAPLAPGNTRFSEAFGLVNKYVAHVALPTWWGGNKNEREYIDSCYSEVLYETDDINASSVVFPILGVGLYGIPYEESLKIAARVITDYLSVKDNLTVFIAVIDEKIFDYIQTNYPSYCIPNSELDHIILKQSLDYKIKHLNHQFMDSLEYYMKRAGVGSVQCYTAAGVDKKLFSKLKNNSNYKPGKTTIIKFAFALHLSLAETQQLLGTCGYILSESLVEDVIIMYYLSQRKYCLEEAYKEISTRSL